MLLSARDEAPAKCGFFVVRAFETFCESEVEKSSSSLSSVSVEWPSVFDLNLWYSLLKSSEIIKVILKPTEKKCGKSDVLFFDSYL